jgi:hypothetical protein
MQVFKVKFDTKFRYLLLSDRAFETEEAMLAYASDKFRFDGVPVDEKTWVPPEMRVFYPRFPAPDFWHLWMNCGAFGVKPHAIGIVEPFLLQAGQLLPLPIKGVNLSICNILECQHCIDEEKSEWQLHPIDGRRTTIRRPFFVAKDIPESSLFKIPELPLEIYTWEENADPEQEFKACVEANNLPGLIFEPMWSEESGIIPYKPSWI